MKLAAVDLIDLVTAGKALNAASVMAISVGCRWLFAIAVWPRLAVLVLRKEKWRSSQLAYSCSQRKKWLTELSGAGHCNELVQFYSEIRLTPGASFVGHVVSADGSRNLTAAD